MQCLVDLGRIHGSETSDDDDDKTRGLLCSSGLAHVLVLTLTRDSVSPVMMHIRL